MYDVDDLDEVHELGGVPQPSGGAPMPIIVSTDDRVVLGYLLDEPDWDGVPGHPLASRGLHSYGAYEVRHSSWIRRLERMNSVHAYHRPERYRTLRHFIFPFKESTFECVCDAFDARIGDGSLAGAVPEMVRMLEWR